MSVKEPGPFREIGIFADKGFFMQHIEAKSILSKLRQADSLFGITYNMNLYRGCQHGCIYCDTRSDCYGIGDISKISVKRNALELLERELRAKRGRKGTIGTGSMNDPYMPAEEKTGIVREALARIAASRFPVHVITKGTLVTRDADILQDISAVYAAVSFTVTCADDAQARILEPGAPPSSARFKAMETLASRSIYTGVTLMPLLPFLTDTVENVREILRRAKDSGAYYVLPMFGTTLRAGSRDYFYRALEKQFPGMKERYVSAFGSRYECRSDNYKALSEVFYGECRQLGLQTRMEFYPGEPQAQMSLF